MGILDQLNGRAATFGRVLVSRPLHRPEVAAAAVALWLGGTAYCALYCRIAFYPMHHGGMPIWKSAWWSGTTLVPWFVAFEAVKRVLPVIRGVVLRIVACLIIAAATITSTIAAYRIADVSFMGLDADRWPTLVASQLQPILLFAVLVVLWAANHNRPAVSDFHVNADPLPPLASIDWIRAAGNYVELKCGDRLLIRRMTMRNVEQATRSADFVRVHRSVIVRRPLIRGFTGRSRSLLLLATGETMPVGDSYRRAVERLIPAAAPGVS